MAKRFFVHLKNHHEISVCLLLSLHLAYERYSITTIANLVLAFADIIIIFVSDHN